MDIQKSRAGVANLSSAELRRIPMPVPNKSFFNLTHSHPFTCNLGEIIPALCLEVVPGQRLELDFELLARFAPMVAPVMHDCMIHVEYIYCPIRLVDPDFENWIMEKNSTSWRYTQITGDLDKTDLGCYLRLPAEGFTGGTTSISVYPAACYSLIYDELYRNPFVQAEKFAALVAGNNAGYATVYQSPPYKRNWNKDYFTTCLLEPQFGDQVKIPMTDPSLGINPAPKWYVDGTTTYAGASTPTFNDGYLRSGASFVGPDLAGQAASIQDLRIASAIQRWREAMLYAGQRYVNYLYGVWGVRSSDARLDRPEYLKGYRGRIMFSEVMSTASTVNSTDTEVSNVGAFAGHGVGVLGSKSPCYTTVEEHGFVYMMVTFQPRSSYFQGMPRMYRRYTAQDYMIPHLASIGDMEVLKEEIYFDSQDSLNDDTFGYQKMYADYTYMNDWISGEFRDTLGMFTLARKFASRPNLNGNFLECYGSVDSAPQIFSVTGAYTQYVWCHVVHKIGTWLPLPKQAIPRLD